MVLTKTWSARLLLASIALIGMVVTSTAQPSGAPVKKEREVIGSGGNVFATANGRFISATIGQPIIGVVNMSRATAYQGFWLPLTPGTITDVDEDVIATSGDDVFAYPNPFNVSTTIRFKMSVIGPVTVNIYDAVGNRIRVLAAEGTEAGGTEIQWDGRDLNGAPVGSGMYVYEVRGVSASDFRSFVRTNRVQIVR
jgi:hypothetical protein